MDTRERVRRGFDFVITAVYKDKPEVLTWLMRHERRDIAIDRVTQQVRTVEFHPKIGRTFSAKQFNTLVHEAAKWFCIFARKEYDTRNLTSAERARLIDLAEAPARLEAEQAELFRELKLDRKDGERST